MIFDKTGTVKKIGIWTVVSLVFISFFALAIFYNNGISSGPAFTGKAIDEVSLVDEPVADVSAPEIIGGGEPSHHSSADLIDAPVETPVRASDLSVMDEPIGKIDPRVIDEIKSRGYAQVIIMLDNSNIETNNFDEETSIQSDQDSVLSTLNTINLGDLPINDISDRGIDFEIKTKYIGVNAIAGIITSSGINKLQNNPKVVRVSLDEMMHLELDGSVPFINGDDVWRMQVNGKNLTGKGETVCVVDSGVNYTHPALAGRVIAQKCFCSIGGLGCCPSGGFQENNAMDGYGHGTHVAGIVASNDTTYRGVAPEANIVAVRVANNFGAVKTSDMVDGIYWCYANHDLYNISVITISIGSGGYNCTPSVRAGFDCSESTAGQYISFAVSSGITVTVASGNDYANDNMSSPACATDAISVGAVARKSDAVADYSNVAECLDVLAPGGNGTDPITSTGKDGGGFALMAGTSMATPHVAGLAALVYQDFHLYNETPTVAEVKKIIKDGGVNVTVTRANNAVIPRINISGSILTIDDRPPVISIVYPLNRAYNSEITQLNYTYYDRNPGFCWFSNNSGLNNYSHRAAGLNFTEMISVEGVNNWTVYCNDSIGNVNRASITFTRDTISPFVSTVYPQGTVYHSSVTQLNYTYSDPHPGYCWYSNNSGANNYSHRAAGLNFTGMVSVYGSNNWIVYCNDSAGNVNNSSVTFTRDTAAPLISISYPQSITYDDSPVTQLNYTVNDLSGFCWYSNNSGANNYSHRAAGLNFTEMISVEGVNNWTVYCNDSTGYVNKSNVTFSVTFLGCREITSSGTHLLNGDILNYGTTNYCMNIKTSNVILDCQGHTIDGVYETSPTLSRGVYAYSTYADYVLTNITIINCKITDFENGVKLVQVSKSNVSNNSITANVIGVVLLSGYSSTFFKNNISRNTQYGVQATKIGGYIYPPAYDSYNNTFLFNEISYNPSGGLYLQDSSKNTIYGNSINHNANGIEFNGALLNDNNITNNSFQQNTNNGIYLPGGSNNSIIGNVITGSIAINLVGSSYNNITDNNATLCSIGLQLTSSLGNNLINNILSRSGTDFVSSGSQNNTVINMTFNSSAYPTTASFVYSGNIKVNSTGAIDSDLQNVSRYLNITNQSMAWVFLNISYTHESIGSNESYLKMYRSDGGVWSLANTTSTLNGVDMANNVVFANISSFSVFAPLANVTSSGQAGTTPVPGLPAFEDLTGTMPAATTATVVDGRAVISATAGNLLIPSGTPIVSFPAGTTGTINVTLSITSSGGGMIIVNGSNLLPGTNKTIFIPRLINTNHVCINDNEGIYSISAACNQPDEILMDCPGTFEQYSCALGDGFYNVSGLTHSGGGEGGTNVSDCINISTEGLYFLNQSINSTGTCFTINSSNVTFDCQGWTINHTGAGSGIDVSGGNLTTIRNCDIVGQSGVTGSYGIYLENSFNGTFINNTARESREAGFYVKSSSYNNFTNNSAWGSGYEGIYLEHGSTNNIFYGNNVSGNSDSGFYLNDNSSNNLFLENIASYNTGTGIMLWSGGLPNTNNNFVRNTAIKNTCSGSCGDNNGHGLLVASSSYNNFSENNFSLNKNNGISLRSSSYNNVFNNTLYDNDNSGAYLTYSSNNTLESNQADSNYYYGISMDNGFGNNFTNNIVSAGTAGFYSTSSSESIIINMTFNGLDYPTTASFVYSGSIQINSTGAPDSTNFYNVSKYLSITNQSEATVNISIAYEGTPIFEDDLLMYRNVSGTWIAVPGSYVNTTTKLVYANLTAFSVFAPLAQVAAPPVANLSCGDPLDQENMTYYLNSSVNSTETCFTIGANNVTLDCQGFTINHTGNGSGVNIPNYNYTTIKNCNILGDILVIDQGNSYGILLYHGSNSNFTNNSAGSHAYGVLLLDNSNYNSFLNNNFSNNRFGIELSSSSNNNLTGNTASDNSDNGIVLSSSSNNNLTENTANNNQMGISLYFNSENNSIAGNNACNNMGYGYGITLGSSSNNNLTNNNADSNNNTGILLASHSLNNNIIGNNASNNEVYGISLYGNGSYNLIVENNLSNNSQAGISLNSDCSYNNLTGNNVNYNNNNGIFLGFYSSNNSISGNNVSNNAASGISLFNNSNYNTIDDNSLGNNSQTGILLTSDCSNNNLTNNNVSNNTNYGINLASSSNNSITNNNAHYNNNAGILLYLSSNNNVTDNHFGNNTGYGLLLSTSSNGNNLTGNDASSISENGTSMLVQNCINNLIDSNILVTRGKQAYGLQIMGSSNNNISKNRITTYGEYLATGSIGIFFVTSTGNFVYGNNLSTIGTAAYGFAAFVSSGNVVENNSISTAGFLALGVGTAGSSNNNFSNNVLNTSLGFGSLYSGLYGPSLNNRITNMTFNSSNYPTTASFVYFGDVEIDSVSSPASTSGFYNISKYLVITNQSEAWVALNISYADVMIDPENESNLLMYEWNETDWNAVPFSGVDNESKIVYANITSFSVFAPLAQVAAPPALETNLSCGDPLNQENMTYYLNNSVNSSGDCFTITADNVTLDCQGNSITGNTTGNAISALWRNNVTITNCTISNYSNGIFFLVSNNSQIINNFAYNNTYEIYLVSSSNNSISENIISGGYEGIYLHSSPDNFVIGNFVENTTYYGIYVFSNSNNNSIIGNNVSYNGMSGITVESSSNNSLSENLAKFNDAGISLLSGAAFNRISYNLFENNNYGIYLDAGNNFIENNTIKDSTVHNLYSYFVSDNIISGNNISGAMGGIGAFFLMGGNNSFTDNNVYGNAYGLVFGASLGNRIINNLFQDNAYGTVSADSSGNNFTNNVVSSFDTDFYSQDSIDDLVINMTFNGSSYPTTASFTVGGNITMNSSDAIDSTGFVNISKYIHISNFSESAWVALNISYADVMIDPENESNLMMYEWNETDWNLVPGSGVDNESKIVYANITSFSVFAPLAEIMGAPLPTEVNISSCENLTTENGVYYLNASNDSVIGTCFIISANNVTLDCQGNSITGDGSGYGVDNSWGHNYTTIKNCTIINFERGIDFENSDYGTIENNNVSLNSQLGIVLGASSDNSLTGNTVSSNGNNGISIGGASYNNNVTGNTVDSNGNNGIDFNCEFDEGNNVIGNTVNNNAISGIAFTGGAYNFVADNTAGNNTVDIVINVGNSNTLDNNTLITTPGQKQQGLFLIGSPDGGEYDAYLANITNSNTINGLPVDYYGGLSRPCPNNEVKDVANVSFFGLYGCTNVTVITTNVTNNLNHLVFANTTNSRVTRINVSDTAMGIEFMESSSNNLTNNTINSILGKGLWFDGADSTNNTIAGNIISNVGPGVLSISGAGIYMNGGGNNHYYNNIFNNSVNVEDTDPAQLKYWNTTNTSGTNIVGGPNMGGNYWASPDGTGFSETSSTCNDTDFDGFCDSAFDIFGDMTQYDYLPLTLLPTPLPDFSPFVLIVYPQGIVYNESITQLNYTVDDISGSCWYSNDSGENNYSHGAAGSNFTEMISVEGVNNWTVYCNNSAGNVNSSNVTFSVDTIPPTISFVSPENITYTNATILINISSSINPLLYQSCADALASGHTENGTYLIDSGDGSGPYTVYCEMDSVNNVAWTLVVRADADGITGLNTVNDYNGIPMPDGSSAKISHQKIQQLVDLSGFTNPVKIELINKDTDELCSAKYIWRGGSWNSSADRNRLASWTDTISNTEHNTVCASLTPPGGDNPGLNNGGGEEWASDSVPWPYQDGVCISNGGFSDDSPNGCYNPSPGSAFCNNGPNWGSVTGCGTTGWYKVNIWVGEEAQEVQQGDPGNIWFFNGTDNETYRSPVYRIFSDGSHTIYAWANDSAGNMNSSNVTFSVDTTPGERNLSCGDPLDQENMTYYLNNSVNSTGTCFTISENNVTLDCQGFSITGNGSGNGIENSGYNFTTIRNCNLTNFTTGIYLDSSHYSNISSNDVYNNSWNSLGGYDWSYSLVGYGIRIEYGSDAIISNNNVHDNNWSSLGYGLLISYNPDSVISNNNVNSNLGLSVYGISPEFSPNSIISSNYVNNNFGLDYLFGITAFGSDDKITVSNNNADNNSCGTGDVKDIIISSVSNDSIISNNNASNNAGGINSYGFYINSVSNSTIFGNNANNNTATVVDGVGAGFVMDTSNNNTLIHNTASLNSFDIALSSSNDNKIVENTFSLASVASIVFVEGVNNSIYNNLLNSTTNVFFFTPSPNFWNTTLDCNTPNIIGGNCTGGNFWATPNGEGFSENATLCNAGSNGICNNGYTMDGSNVDYLPLTNLTPVAEAPANLSCGDPLNETGRTYYLNNSVNSAGTCFTIGANNVTLDCLGNTINYSQSEFGFGILIDGYNNATIRNCTITNGDDSISDSYGIVIANYANDSLIYKNNFNIKNGHAIHAFSADRLIIYENNITASNHSVGVSVQYGNHHNISLNNFIMEGSIGVQFDNCFKSSVSLNNITTYGTHSDMLSGWGGHGVYVSFSEENNITLNNISTYGYSEDAISFWTSNKNLVRNNHLFSNRTSSVMIHSSSNENIIEENEAYGAQSAMRIIGSFDNNLTNNIVSSSSADLVLTGSSTGNIITNMTFNSSIYPTTASLTSEGDIRVYSSSGQSSLRYYNVSKYLDITNNSKAWVNLSISYLGVPMGPINESTLKMYRWNETMWSEVSGNRRDNVSKTVYANITSFSTFAILAEIPCTPSLINDTPAWTDISMCRINDTILQQRNITEYDQNFCRENVTFTEYNETDCNYCDYNVTNMTGLWQDQTGCRINDTILQNRSITEFDSNYSTCFGITGLISDRWNLGLNNTYWEFNETECDNCTPSLTNSSISPLINLSCSGIQMNQSQFVTQYDLNGCYAKTGLSSDNIVNTTFYNYSLVGPTYANTSWSDWTNVSCLPSNVLNQSQERTQFDVYGCGGNTTFKNYTQTEFCDFDTNPPIITIVNPVDGSALAAGTTETWINITTDEVAECRYNLTNHTFNFAYGAAFTNTNALVHSFNYSNLTAGSYKLYYKCNDSDGNVATQSKNHSFSIASPTPIPSTGGGGGGGRAATVAAPNVSAPVCYENWQCSEFGECIAGTQTRTCNDVNKCGTATNKPSEGQGCEVPAVAPTVGKESFLDRLSRWAGSMAGSISGFFGNVGRGLKGAAIQIVLGIVLTTVIAMVIRDLLVMRSIRMHYIENNGINPLTARGGRRIKQISYDDYFGKEMGKLK